MLPQIPYSAQENVFCVFYAIKCVIFHLKMHMDMSSLLEFDFENITFLSRIC